MSFAAILCAFPADDNVLGFEMDIPQLECSDFSTTTTAPDGGGSRIKSNFPGLIRLGRFDDCSQLLNRGCLADLALQFRQGLVLGLKLGCPAPGIFQHTA